MDNEKKIVKFLKNNYGYITTADFIKLNISKPTIHDFISNGLIEKVSHGLYMSTKQFKD